MRRRDTSSLIPESNDNVLLQELIKRKRHDINHLDQYCHHEWSYSLPGERVLLLEVSRRQEGRRWKPVHQWPPATLLFAQRCDLLTDVVVLDQSKCVLTRQSYCRRPCLWWCALPCPRVYKCKYICVYLCVSLCVSFFLCTFVYYCVCLCVCRPCVFMHLYLYVYVCMYVM